MENAAHALKIVGAILIALLTIAVLVWGLGIIQTIPKGEEKAKKQKEIADFNLQFEAYNKDKLYGVDVVSVINKAIDNNKKNNGQEDYKITIYWYPDVGNGFCFDTDYIKKEIIIEEGVLLTGGTKKEILDYRIAEYWCSDVTYQDDNGRIESMTFKCLN